MNSERKFFQQFLAILVFLVVFSMGIFFFVTEISAVTLTEGVRSPAAEQRAEVERLKPVGEVRLASQANAAAQSAADEAANEATAEAATVVATASAERSGEEVYNQACVACHGAGIAGAPKFGDVAGWEARLAQGMEMLQERAIVGYQGEAGFMPAKGGRMDLSDAEVDSAVEYMAAASQ